MPRKRACPNAQPTVISHDRLRHHVVVSRPCCVQTTSSMRIQTHVPRMSCRCWSRLRRCRRCTRVPRPCLQPLPLSSSKPK
eukprot:2613097-Pleurochrysis_carterae.AAC.2